MRQKISGCVLANYKKGKDKNWLFIHSKQYYDIFVKAVLSDADAEGISMNDYIQLSGIPRRTQMKTSYGEEIPYVLIMKPEVERRIRMNDPLLMNKTRE